MDDRTPNAFYNGEEFFKIKATKAKSEQILSRKRKNE